MDDLVRIKKYPNRRLYDQTHSRHLTQEQLRELVSSGRRVRITDSTSGGDITNAVLMQLLADREATTLSAIPSVFMHLLVCGQESLVRTGLEQSVRWMGLDETARPSKEERAVSSEPRDEGRSRPPASRHDEVAALRRAMGELLGQLRAVESRLAELEHRSTGGADPDPRERSGD